MRGMRTIYIPYPMTVHEDALARPPNKTIDLDTRTCASASPGYGVENYVWWLELTVLPHFQLHHEMYSLGAIYMAHSTQGN